MSHRVLIMLGHSILGEAVRVFLSTKRGVEVVHGRGGASETDLRSLQPDVILIEEERSSEVPAYLGTVPRARVITFARDGGLTIYQRYEMRVTRLDELLQVIEAG